MLINLLINLYGNVGVENLLLDQRVFVYTHAVTQLMSVCMFLVFYLLIVESKGSSRSLMLIAQGYIYSLFAHCLIAIIIMALEFGQIKILDHDEHIGLVKMQGMLGEPKQFAAAVFSGFLLLNFTMKDAKIKAVSQRTSIMVRSVFLICAFASLSTGVMANFLILMVLIPFWKSRLVSGIALFGFVIAVYMALGTNNPCNYTGRYDQIQSGADSIFDKAKSLDNILAYAPKDGVVILDAACQPEKYVFGGGAGSLFSRLMSNDLANYDWYKEIGIFRAIIYGDIANKQGPSMLLVALLADYGIVGIAFIAIFLLSLEARLIKKGGGKPHLVPYIIVMANTLTYMWILIGLHFIVLKSNETNKLK